MEQGDGRTPDNRQRLLEAIRSHPGTHMRELQRRLDMPTGLIRFHLDALEADGEISSQKDRYYRRYYPERTLTGDERLILSCLRQSNPRRIVLYLLERGDTNHKTLMEDIGLRASTLSFYLKDLVSKGVVSKMKKGRVSWYWVGDSETVVRILRSYRPSFLDTLVDRFLQTWFER